MNDLFFIIDRGSKKEAKYCLNCKKIFVNRKKWKDNFKEINFCSKKCKFEFKNPNKYI